MCPQQSCRQLYSSDVESKASREGAAAGTWALRAHYMPVTQVRLSGWKTGGWQEGETEAHSPASNPPEQRLVPAD